MRLFVSLLVGTILFGGSALAAPEATVIVSPDAEGMMTLDQAVEIALKNSETVAINREGLVSAHAKVREVTASGLPTVTVAGQVLRQKEVSFSLPMGDTVQEVTISPKYSRVAQASVNQILDIFGLVRKAKQMASIGEQIQALNLARSRSEVIFQTRAAYYNVLRANGAVEVATAAVREAEEQLRLARAFVGEGASPKFDQTRAEVALADKQQSLISALNTLQLAGAAFNNALARPVDTPVTITPLDDAVSREVDIAGQTEKALESRPEILQAGLGVKAGRVNVGLQKLGNKPTVALTGAYSYNFTASGFSTEKGNWNTGIGVSWPLWDSGSTRAKVDGAKADARASELQVEQARRGVALEVRNAGLQVQTAADRYDVALKVLDQAEEALRLARARYQNGVSTQLEVIDAEAALTAAQFNLNNSRYDYLQARADFDRALMGRLSG
ncbi:MAG: TolC family protein [Armatimonadetes bacterium]|nr:TolC family protein [Armatimonadota bacterium]